MDWKKSKGLRQAIKEHKGKKLDFIVYIFGLLTLFMVFCVAVIYLF